MFEAKAGNLLIAEPFLKDPNFTRTVVFLCEHLHEGSFGLIINRPINLTLSDVFEDLNGSRVPIYFGGPVNMDTIHILHQLPDVIPNSVQVTEGIYWGGDFDLVVNMMKTGMLDTTKINFYLGYSSWTDGQLQREISETSSWLTTDATTKLVFNTKTQNIWQNSIFTLGQKYAPLVNYPIDPHLN